MTILGEYVLEQFGVIVFEETGKFGLGFCTPNSYDRLADITR